MNKRNSLAYLMCMIAASSAGLAAAPQDAQAQDSVNSLLKPVVFIAFDTSSSMNASFGNNGNTRFTSALQQLTGTVLTPKDDNPTNSCNICSERGNNNCNKYKIGSDANTLYKVTRYPRQVLECSNGICDYKTVFVCAKHYTGKGRCDYHNVDICKNCVNFSNTNTRDNYGYSEDDGDDCTTSSKSGSRTTVRNLKYGFDGDLEEFEKSYKNDGALHKYLTAAKFGFVAMADYKVDRVDGFVGGVNKISKSDESDAKYGIKDYNGKVGQQGEVGFGIWNAVINGPSPTIYPTPSDDDEIVRKSNLALINNLRSYTLTSMQTPVTGYLEDLGYMFNNESKVDQGLLKQPKSGTKYSNSSQIEYLTDPQWSCRKKAVIAMTDGSPAQYDRSAKIANGKRVSEMDKVVSSLRQKNSNMTIYSVLYAQGEKDITKFGPGRSTYNKNASDVGVMQCLDNISWDGSKNDCVDGVMNLIAWKGGTCHKYGHIGDLIDPDDKAAFDKYLTAYIKGKYDGDERKVDPCYYNAIEGDALRKSITQILNELSEGYVSKSKMVTTTAVGKQTTKYNSKPTNGWYNIYSGYNVALGAIKRTDLQREAFVCRKGSFEFDKNLSIDMAKKLRTRLEGVQNSAGNYEGGCQSDGNCITNRAIFVGDYSSTSESLTKGRYALYPEIIHISNEKAGQIQYKPDEKSTKLDTYKFFDKNVGFEDALKKTKETYITSGDSAFEDYIISPYECVTNVDCIAKMNAIGDSSALYTCDQGKCIPETNGDYCTSTCSGNQVCLNTQCRDKGGACSKHEDCSDNEVCHLGSCVTGVLNNGDIRDLVSSIPLGTIEYASPVVVPPPSYMYKSTEYMSFKNQYGNRDTMLYMPTNDGMLHAFVLGKNDTDADYHKLFTNSPKLETPSESNQQNEGEEVWAFMPKRVLPKIHELTKFEGTPMINATPVTADVRVPVRDSAGHVTYEWRSILVGGFRDADRGYYALDVTDPEKPEILWEIDHQWQPGTAVDYPPIDEEKVITKDKEAGLIDKYPFLRMGKSYPEAVITNVIVNNVVEPVAIISGGMGKGGDDITGKAVYIVRLKPADKDHLLVKAFNFDTQITGTPAVFPAGFNAIARLIYVGDEKGALHRIDISGDFDDWDQTALNYDGDKVVPIFDPNNIKALNPDNSSYEKMTYKPAVSALTTTGYPDIQIAFGSGDSSNVSIGAQSLNYVAIMVDHYNATDKKYHLNNLYPEATNASTRNLKPLVLVFNPTPGIHSTDGKLQTFETDIGKQLFEIVVSKAVNPHDIENDEINTCQNNGGCDQPQSDGQCPSCCGQGTELCSKNCYEEGALITCNIEANCFQCNGIDDKSGCDASCNSSMCDRTKCQGCDFCPCGNECRNKHDELCASVCDMSGELCREDCGKKLSENQQLCADEVTKCEEQHKAEKDQKVQACKNDCKTRNYDEDISQCVDECKDANQVDENTVWQCRGEGKEYESKNSCIRNCSQDSGKCKQKLGPGSYCVKSVTKEKNWWLFKTESEKMEKWSSKEACENECKHVGKCEYLWDGPFTKKYFCVTEPLNPEGFLSCLVNNIVQEGKDCDYTLCLPKTNTTGDPNKYQSCLTDDYEKKCKQNAIDMCQKACEDIPIESCDDESCENSAMSEYNTCGDACATTQHACDEKCDGEMDICKQACVDDRDKCLEDHFDEQCFKTYTSCLQKLNDLSKIKPEDQDCSRCYNYCKPYDTGFAWKCGEGGGGEDKRIFDGTCVGEEGKNRELDKCGKNDRDASVCRNTVNEKYEADKAKRDAYCGGQDCHTTEYVDWQRCKHSDGSSTQYEFLDCILYCTDEAPADNGVISSSAKHLYSSGCTYQKADASYLNCDNELFRECVDKCDPEAIDVCTDNYISCACDGVQTPDTDDDYTGKKVVCHWPGNELDGQDMTGLCPGDACPCVEHGECNTGGNGTVCKDGSSDHVYDDAHAYQCNENGKCANSECIKTQSFWCEFADNPRYEGKAYTIDNNASCKSMCVLPHYEICTDDCQDNKSEEYCSPLVAKGDCYKSDVAADCAKSCGKCVACAPSDPSAATERWGGPGSRERAAKRDAGGKDDDNLVSIRPRQKLMGAPFTYNFKTYFPTYNAPDLDKDEAQVVCDSGFASIWYADRYIGKSRWSVKTTGVQNQSQFDDVTGSVDHGKEASSFKNKVFANGGFINLGAGTIVYGLSMTTQSTCYDDENKTTSVAAPMLVAQTGMAAGVEGATTNASHKNGTTNKKDITPGQSTDVEVMAINEEAIQAQAQVLSWASVYE